MKSDKANLRKGLVMIRHIVLVKFQSGIKQDDITSLFDALANLGTLIPGMRGFDGGISVSPEKLEQGFRHGFCIDFDDAAARDAYLEHPEHQKLGGQLVGMLEGGLAGLVVFDLEMA
ncbi:Dabb family protein [Thalassospira sp. MCCC 1A02491]|uniref:Dabb family protein n=1 Tax=Thalassospira sp. MCCC 1A02491 TaxID=1769751 RepID=UPI000AE8995D|nr:Dabb family protein [Thalassospira sp. MCCC 1A02491]